MIKKYNKEKNNLSLKNIVEDIDLISNEFEVTKSSGFPTLEILHGEDFEDWKASIQFEMKNLEKDEFISSIIDLTNSFNGWNDKQIFLQLSSKLRILYENSNAYYENDAERGNILDKTSVFVVHGRNGKIKRSMFSFLRSIGLNPIEWDIARNMTGKTTPYTGEILDVVFSTAQAVIVLITPDDEAKLKDEFITTNDKEYEMNLTPQARPNVIYEAGMAMGRCPDRTILIEFGDNLRPFSDITGMNVIKMIDSPEKRNSLINTLKTAGLDIDIDGKVDWLNEGDFNL